MPGNFPQAFTHLSLINTAFLLSLPAQKAVRSDRERRRLPRQRGTSGVNRRRGSSA